MNASSIKRILIPLDLSSFSTSATRAACAIAQHHAASVDGLVVLDLPEIIGQDVPYHAWMQPDALVKNAARAKEAKKRISEALARFKEVCESENVSHFEAAKQGVPADRILESASFHDLVVIGLRTFFHFETDDSAGDTLEEILRAPQTPILAVPESSPNDWRRVLIAFDGSPSACKALKEFARLAQAYEMDITLLMSAKDKAIAETCTEAAREYLLAHGLKQIETVVSDDDILELLHAKYLNTFDLIVSGSHSRKYLKDFFVGSVARKLIDHGETALLLS
ncbi:MAG: nucleotide-binding universal stress UspA family protein [Verrucomicrobiales bacterium]|jgi:nucleotide-binding universal stress UspA family protein